MTDIAASIQQQKTLLIDGATGTNLFEMGLTSGQAPELWNISEPEKISALHQGFIEAGSDIILTNSFGGNARRLMLHQAQDQVAEINVAAAKIARQCADQSEKTVFILASIGPTGDLLAPLGELTQAEAEDCFAEQAVALAMSGVDGFWIETLSAIEEAEAAINGIKRVSDLPIFLSMSFDTAGRTMMGINPKDLPTMLQKQNLDTFAVGANCGLGPAELLETLMEMRKFHPDAQLIAKSNYGIPEFKSGRFHYHGTADLMADYARYCCDLKVAIIGGCCGTSKETIAVMRQAIDEHEPRELTEELLAEIREFIRKNRASPAQSLSSKEPTDQPSSGRRSARRSQSRRQR